MCEITKTFSFASLLLNRYQTSIDEIKKYIDNLNNEIEELQEQLTAAEAAKVKQKEQKTYLDTARYLMQDTGIKTKIIKQYLPIMNQFINKNLADMDFFVNFTLDEEFNETIKSRYRDEFNYHSFSEGEKLRIDLAILFTWREIAKLKNSTNTNLLINWFIIGRYCLMIFVLIPVSCIRYLAVSR